MDNDAFRALVNQQRGSSTGDKEKSTKEIAREAVEEEFQKKRRRGGGRRGHDDGSSSDEDMGGRHLRKDKENGASEQDDRSDWKRRRREKRQRDGSGTGGDASEYRDRAKERREGNNLDYADLQGLTHSGDRKRQVELSKYLGGDEEHTHLVKGLDKALAEKVRREEMGEGGAADSGDLDQALEDAYASKQGQRAPQEARGGLNAEPTTQLGKSVLEYLLQKKHQGSTQIKSNPTIQKSIQRSVLTFSLESDVRCRKLAWEVPRISVRAAGNSQGTAKITPLSQHMIHTISKKLDDKRVEGVSQTKNGSNPLSRANGGETRGQKSGEANTDTKIKANGHRTSKSKSNSDDSEDDIFENAGTYVPEALRPKYSKVDPAANNIGKGDKSAANKNGKNNDPANDSHKQSKQSIFEHLLPEPAPRKTTLPRHRQQKHAPQQSARQNRKVIERDVFGGKDRLNSPSQTFSKRRGPTLAAIEGVSMASYQGGYGEEMDVDFGGYEDGKRKDKGDKIKGGANAGDDNKDDKIESDVEED